MKATHLVFITFTLLCVLCNAQSPHSAKTDTIEETHPNCVKGTTMTGRISVILAMGFGKQIENLKIETVKLDKCSLFWSDPGYVRGPDIAVEDSCYAVRFTTHTFNLENGGYSDDYVLYFPFHKKFGIWWNHYYGKNYHGGSLKVVPDSTNRSFEALQRVLVHTKDKMWYQIEQEIQKK